MRTKKGIARPNGHRIKFLQNAAVVLNENKDPAFTRVFVDHYPPFVHRCLHDATPRRTAAARRGPAGRLARGVGKFLDRIFCQLFHSNEQIKRYVLHEKKKEGEADAKADGGDAAMPPPEPPC